MDEVRRHELLNRLGQTLIGAGQAGALTGNAERPIAIQHVDTIAGPRAGAVELHAGVQAGDLLKALTKDNGAVLRQFIPWEFTGAPAAYLPHGSRAVRVEAGWPDELAEKDITLESIGANPRQPGRWIVGKNEMGRTVVAGFDDEKPGYLLGGETGSGKSFANRSIVAQLSGAAWGRLNSTRLVLIDGKYGEGLGEVAGLPGIAGPLATDITAARAALGWAHQQMMDRYQKRFQSWPEAEKERAGRLVVVADEVQEIIRDPAIAALLRRLANQGRAVRVYTLIATHHPTADVLGEDGSVLKAGLPGRIAMRVTSPEASRVVIGASDPRADRLLGCGDSYVVALSKVHRVQWAYIPPARLKSMSGAQPELAAWPAFDPGQVGISPDDGRANGNGNGGFGGKELAVSLAAAFLGHGRPTLVKALEVVGLGRIGSDRADRLLAEGREAQTWLSENDYKLVVSGEAAPDDADPADIANGRVNWNYTGEELGAALLIACQNQGRPALVKALEAAGLGRPGSDRAERLLDLGRIAVRWMSENGCAFNMADWASS